MLSQDSDDFFDIENVDNEVMQPLEEALHNCNLKLNLDDNNEQNEPIKQESYSDFETHILQSNNLEIPVEVIEKEKPKTYLELVELDDINCVSNSEPFECPVCFLDTDVGEGIVLRDCLHTFCKY